MSVEGDEEPHLVEKFGPMKFQYDIRVDDGIIQYKTSRFSIFNVPIPSVIAPRSEWEERPTGMWNCWKNLGQRLKISFAETGWTFEGKIQMPILGQLMYYKGSFDVSKEDL